METNLSELKLGEKVVITGFKSGDMRYREKLLSMGLTKGTLIIFRKKAPMGDPVEIEVRGYHLSLRKHEAEILKLRRVEG